jgi:hypothetical protein
VVLEVVVKIRGVLADLEVVALEPSETLETLVMEPMVEDLAAELLQTPAWHLNQSAVTAATVSLFLVMFLNYHEKICQSQSR